MNLELRYPAASCSMLPRTFPTPGGETETEWYEGVAAHYSRAHGELGGVRRAALRNLLEAKRRDVLPADAATILFRPTSMPVFATIHVQVHARAGAEVEALIDRVGMPAVPLALRPRVEGFPSDALGIGRKAAFVGAVVVDDTMAGLSYLFADARRVVTVFTSPATPAVVGALEPVLDDIVRTIRVGPTDASAPARAAVEGRWGVLPIGRRDGAP